MIAATVKVNLAPLAKFRQTLDADLRGGGMGPVRKALQQWGGIYRQFLQERFVTLSRGGGDWKPLSPKTIAARQRRPVARLKAQLKHGEITKAEYKRKLKQATSRMNKAAVMRSARKAGIDVGKQVYDQAAAKAARQLASGTITHDAYDRKIKSAAKRGLQANITAGGAVAILRDTGLLFEAVSPQLGRPGQLQENIPFGIRVGFGGPAMHGQGITIAGLAAIHQVGGKHLPARPIVAPPSKPVLDHMAAVMEKAIRDMQEGSGS